MFIGYFLMGYLLALLKIEKMTDILRMRRFQTLMASVRVEIRQNLWQVRFVLLRMLWSANLKAGGFLFIIKTREKKKEKKKHKSHNKNQLKNIKTN